MTCLAGTSCADGFCCDSTCSGVCETCALPGSEGTCTAVPSGELPMHGACAAPGNALCGSGFCDGSDPSQCKFTAGTSCGLTTCTGHLISGGLCDSEGDCSHVSTPVACLNSLVCQTAGECRTACSADSHCVTGTYCDLSKNSCVGILEAGEACEMDGQCDTEHCVDGVCCNSECEDQCEACDVVGSVGVCSVVPADDAPHGTRPTCDSGNDENCGGACDGSARVCVYYECIDEDGADGDGDGGGQTSDGDGDKGGCSVAAARGRSAPGPSGGLFALAALAGLALSRRKRFGA